MEFTILPLFMTVSLHNTKDKNLHEKLYYTELYICSTQTTPHNVTLSSCVIIQFYTSKTQSVCVRAGGGQSQSSSHLKATQQSPTVKITYSQNFRQ
jgi:hypothetical protein